MLPAIVSTVVAGDLTPLPAAHLIPTLIANAGEQARWCYTTQGTQPSVAQPCALKSIVLLCYMIDLTPRCCRSQAGWCENQEFCTKI
jgi:hypothetical protein